jgi:hypothetical protein
MILIMYGEINNLHTILNVVPTMVEAHIHAASFELTKFHEELKFKIKYHSSCSSSSSSNSRRAGWTHACKITC